MHAHRFFILSIVAVASCAGFLVESRGGSLRTVAVTGAPANGVYPDVFGGFNGVTLDANGEVAFYAGVTGPEVTAANNTGIWRDRNGMLAPVVREGEQVPGVLTGVMFGEFSLTSTPHLLFNTSGRIVFPAELRGIGVTSGNSASIWSDTEGDTRLIARNGDRAPGTPEGVRFSDVNMLFSNGRISLNEEGSVGFAAITRTDGLGPRDPGYQGQGIWIDNGTELTKVVQNGALVGADSFPPTAAFQSFSSVMLTSAGEIVFRTVVSGASGQSVGIWSTDSGAFVPVAIQGMQVPGAPAGVRYADSFGVPAIAPNDKIAFHARIQGLLGFGDYGVWGGDVGDLQLMAFDREDAPGVTGEVFESALGNPFTTPVINSAGDVAFIAESRRFPTSLRSTGVWASHNGLLDVVAALGVEINSNGHSQLPNLPAGIAFSLLSGVAINSSGQVSFNSLLRGNGITDSNDLAIWAVDRAGQLKLVVREGDSIEVAPGDFRTIAELVRSADGGGPSMGKSRTFNDLGQVAFHARFTDGTEGVFVSNLVAVPEPASLVGISLPFAIAAVCHRRLKRRNGFPKFKSST